MPLSAALRTVFSRTRSDYVLALGNLGNTEVSGDFDGTSLESVLDALLTRGPVSGKLVALDEEEVRVVTSSQDRGEPGKISLRFYRRGATEALSALFAAAHEGCVISSDLQGAQVTASLHNVDFESALESIISSLPIPVTYRVEKGIYHIVPKR